MSIENITNRLQSAGLPRAVNKTTPESPNASAPVAAEDSVALTGPANLQQAMEVLSATPIVNSERVATLKAAIAQGQYTIDPERIANKILEFEQNTT